MVNLQLLLEHLLLEARIDFLKEKFVDNGNITPENFDKLLDADPTREKKFLQWLLSNASKMNLPSVSDSLHRDLKNGLDLFSRVASNKNLSVNFENKDINQYKTFRDFVWDYQKVDKALTDVEKLKGKNKADKWQEFLLKDNVAGYRIYRIPQTSVHGLDKKRSDLLYTAACELGSGTNWCTAFEKYGNGSWDNQLFTYLPEGNIYILISNLDKSEKFQIHFESNQFMNKYDGDVFTGSKDVFAGSKGIYDNIDLVKAGLYCAMDEYGKDRILPRLKKTSDEDPAKTDKGKQYNYAIFEIEYKKHKSLKFLDFQVLENGFELRGRTTGLTQEEILKKVTEENLFDYFISSIGDSLELYRDEETGKVNVNDIEIRAFYDDFWWEDIQEEFYGDGDDGGFESVERLISIYNDCVKFNQSKPKSKVKKSIVFLASLDNKIGIAVWEKGPLPLNFFNKLEEDGFFTDIERNRIDVEEKSNGYVVSLPAAIEGIVDALHNFFD